MFASGPSTARITSATVISLGGPREPVAAARAALGPDQAGVLELEQDVLQELQRDVLRFGQLLALDGLAVGRSGELERGAHRVVGLCRRSSLSLVSNAALR